MRFVAALFFASFVGCFCKILSCFFSDEDVFVGQPVDGKKRMDNMCKPTLPEPHNQIVRDLGLSQDLEKASHFKMHFRDLSSFCTLLSMFNL